MKPFLTAQWRKLIILTYAVDPSLLEDYLPMGLSLDSLRNNKAFVSFVAFDFLNTRVRGIPIPFHVNFPEVNLRFYVRHTKADGSIERGVVFIKELVPRYCIAQVANKIYNEPYDTAQMESETHYEGNQIHVQHEFRYQGQKHKLKFIAENEPYLPQEGSTEHFFKEHEWGFGLNKRGKLLKYRVEHPAWKIYPIRKRFLFQVDFGSLYGQEWQFLNTKIPYNILLAEGSPIKVFPGKPV